MHSFIDQRGFAGAARSDHGDDAVLSNGRLKPVLQLLELGLTAAEMLVAACGKTAVARRGSWRPGRNRQVVEASTASRTLSR
jgi:hypothetical protein